MIGSEGVGEAQAASHVWSRIVDTATLEWLAAEAPAMPRLAPLGRASIRDIPDGRAFRLHEPDDPQGEDFRWTQGVAVLQLPFTKGAKELRLETAPLRPPDAPLCLWAFVNGRRLPPRAVSVEPERRANSTAAATSAVPEQLTLTSGPPSRMILKAAGTPGSDGPRTSLGQDPEVVDRRGRGCCGHEPPPCLAVPKPVASNPTRRNHPSVIVATL